MKKRNLDKKFRHHAWFKGESMTIATFLHYAASERDFYIKRKDVVKRGATKNIFDDVLNDVPFLTDGRYTIKLTEEEYLYFEILRSEITFKK